MPQHARTDSTEASEHRYHRHRHVRTDVDVEADANADTRGEGDGEGTLNAYLYNTTGTSVLDFILLGRLTTLSHAQAHMLDAMVMQPPQQARGLSVPFLGLVHRGEDDDDDGTGNGRDQMGRCTTVSELMTFMDQITDPKIVREAIVFRPLLVDRPY